MDEKDLRVDVYTNNTGVVAVRIVHTPTGTVVTGVSKRNAMEKMREALAADAE